MGIDEAIEILEEIEKQQTNDKYINALEIALMFLEEKRDSYNDDM